MEYGTAHRAGCWSLQIGLRLVPFFEAGEMKTVTAGCVGGGNFLGLDIHNADVTALRSETGAKPDLHGRTICAQHDDWFVSLMIGS